MEEGKKKRKKSEKRKEEGKRKKKKSIRRKEEELENAFPEGNTSA